MNLWLKQLKLLFVKDLRLEWRSWSRLTAQLGFALLCLLLFSFAVGPQAILLRRLAPGFLWLGVLLASVLGLNESMRLELQEGAWSGLKLLGVDPRALFVAKALGNALSQGVCALLLVPLCLALYDAQLRLGVGHLAVVLLLGVGAIAAPGTFYAAMAAQLKGRDVLLPLLLFPLLVPGLLASVRATAVVFAGDPMNEWGSWVALLGAFNVLYWVLCTALFESVSET